MAQKRERAAPRQRATLPHNIPMQLASYGTEDSRPLPEIQCDFLAARFGLSVERARLTAQLAGWRL